MSIAPAVPIIINVIFYVGDRRFILLRLRPSLAAPGNQASGSKAMSKAKKYKAKVKVTNYHLLLKQSTALHYGNAVATINVSRLKNV